MPVLVLVVGLDVSAIVPAARGADAVQDDAQVLGLELLEGIAHPLEQAAAVRAGTNDRDHAIDARGQGNRLGDHQHRAGVEDDVVVLFQGSLDKVDQELALHQFRRIDGLGTADQHFQIRNLSRTNRLLKVIHGIQHVAETEFVAQPENLVKLGPAEVGVHEEDSPAIERQARGEIDGDGRLAVAGTGAGHQDAPRRVQRRGVLEPRPHLPQHDVEFSQISKNYRVRALVKPGITGLAQVNGYRGEITDPEKLHRRVYWDLYYVSNWSLAMDVQVILRTAWQVVFPPKSAY